MTVMKTRKRFFFVHGLVFISALLAFAAGQEQQKEYVQVVNVEMILRVLKDGVPVAGLKKSDFTLYEDGEPCDINGFFENHRRIAHAGESKKQLQQPRLYLLFFWVGNPAADDPDCGLLTSLEFQDVLCGSITDEIELVVLDDAVGWLLRGRRRTARPICATQAAANTSALLLLAVISASDAAPCSVTISSA